MRKIAALLVVAVAGATACQDTLAPLLVASIAVEPVADTLGVGQTVRLRATLTRATGDTLTGLQVDWTSSDATVAAVDSTGRVTAVGIGTAALTAAIGVQSARASITVTDSAPVISRVSPSIGTAGTKLTIRGRHFRPGVSVLLNTLAADSVSLPSDTVVVALAPEGVDTAGAYYSVSVHNSDGSTAALGSAFRVSAPILRFLNGASEPSADAGSPVVLEGSAFGDRQAEGLVLFSDGAGGTISATIASPSDWTNTAIVTTVPSGASTGDVTVQTASGTSDAVRVTVAAPPTFDPAALAWTGATALPVGLSGHAAAAGAVGTGTVVYVIGGVDSSAVPRADVLYSAVQSDGQLGVWTATAPLPTATAFGAAVVATPFNSRIKDRPGVLYLLGGVNAAGPAATVFLGPLDASGGVLSWSGRGLPAALHSAGAVLFHGDLYVVGGSGSGDAPVATVYRARIDSLGGLGPWQAEPTLPFPRSYGAVGAAAGYLYVLGGDSAAVSPNDPDASSGTMLAQIAYAKIDLATGDLANAGWSVTGGSLAKAVSKHSAVIAGGSVLVTGGLYAGATTGSSEELYASLNSDGSVGSFTDGGASQTIASAGGANLFNHVAVSYVDVDGVTHVLVIGGDDVNAPGKKRADVWRY